MAVGEPYQINVSIKSDYLNGPPKGWSAESTYQLGKNERKGSCDRSAIEPDCLVQLAGQASCEVVKFVDSSLILKIARISARKREKSLNRLLEDDNIERTARLVTV